MSEPETLQELFNKLINSETFTFPLKGKVGVSSKHGVYIIFSPENEVLHVGNTPSGKEGLNQRLYNHISCTGIFYRAYLKPNGIKMRGTHTFKFIEVALPRERALLEALTAGLLCPKHFGTGEKKLKPQSS